MNKIKFNKQRGNDNVKLGYYDETTEETSWVEYRAYKICDLPPNFGCKEFNNKEGISEWFKLGGLTYILK